MSTSSSNILIGRQTLETSVQLGYILLNLGKGGIFSYFFRVGLTISKFGIKILSCMDDQC